jgi:hypothetical protein
MKAVAIAFVILVLASVVAIYATASVAASPVHTAESQSLYSYSGTTAFSYLATLAPNHLYNQSTLGPGQGTLYAAIVRTLNLSYQFSLSISQPATLLLTEGFVLTLAAPHEWNYTLNESVIALPEQTGVEGASATVSTALNVTQLYSFASEIANETHFTPSTYFLNFTASLTAIVDAAGSPTAYQFAPVLSFAASSVELDPGGLSRSFYVPVNQTHVVTNSGRTDDLDLGAVVSGVLLVGAGITGYLAFRSRGETRSVRREMRRFTEPYRDAIAVTGTPPRGQNLVVVADWMDLVHVADMLAKPILRWEYAKVEPSRHLFYVLDGSTEYVYLVPREGRPDEEVLAELR